VATQLLEIQPVKWSLTWELVERFLLQGRLRRDGAVLQLWSVNQQANGVTTEAEESPLLRFVTRKRLVKAD
jgi:hypothetical protein